MTEEEFQPPMISQDTIDQLAERMARISETSLIEGASRDQMVLWMRTALFRTIVRGEPA